MYIHLFNTGDIAQTCDFVNQFENSQSFSRCTSIKFLSHRLVICAQEHFFHFNIYNVVLKIMHIIIIYWK